jgi:hypothetical protein
MSSQIKGPEIVLMPMYLVVTVTSYHCKLPSSHSSRASMRHAYIVLDSDRRIELSVTDIIRVRV